MPVEFNKILHTVSNRNSFASPLFNVFSDYTPYDDTGPARDTRRLLNLHVDYTDYFLQHVLVAIDSFYDIKAAFNEKARTYDMRCVRLVDEGINGATLVADNEGPPRVARQANTYPPFFEMKIRWYAADKVTITPSTGNAMFADARLVGDRVAISWPEHLGIHGYLKPADDNPWQPGFEVDFSSVPTSFPYDLVAAKLQDYPSFLSLLTTSGLAPAFYATHLPEEKVAIAALAVAQTCPDF